MQHKKAGITQKECLKGNNSKLNVVQDYCDQLMEKRLLKSNAKFVLLKTDTIYSEPQLQGTSLGVFTTKLVL